jgi:3-dehydroquinate synthetase
MILDGLKYKIDILTRDEFDKGERKFLNFGHTFGHALESTFLNNYIPHGIAVILGSMIAVKVSKKLGYKIPNYELILEKGINLIKASKIPFNLTGLIPPIT